MKSIAALITCHNRKEKTLACLESLFKNTLTDDYSLYVVLVDDGSTDGTESAVKELFPEVEILRGDGNLFWNRGMHKAFARALEIGFDGYLWLNDDTILYPYAFQNLICAWKNHMSSTGDEALYVGSTQDSQTGQLTYGGIVQHSLFKPFNLSLVPPGKEQLLECHTMNGNCVLIPHKVATLLGNLDSTFAHAMGDIDYGLRARKAGIKSCVVPGFIGTCDKNPITGTFNDRSLPTRERWNKMMQPKGLPPSSWLVLTRRHGGLLWPLYGVWPYVKVLLSALPRFRRFRLGKLML